MDSHVLSVSIDALVAQHLGVSFPAAQIVVRQHSEIIYAKAFGDLDPDQTHQTSNTQPYGSTNLQTRFDLASVSKLFTVTAFMTLVQEGRVAMDQPVCEVLHAFSGLRPIAPQQDPLGSGQLVAIVPTDGTPVDATR